MVLTKYNAVPSAKPFSYSVERTTLEVVAGLNEASNPTPVLPACASYAYRVAGVLAVT